MTGSSVCFPNVIVWYSNKPLLTHMDGTSEVCSCIHMVKTQFVKVHLLIVFTHFCVNTRWITGSRTLYIRKGFNILTERFIWCIKTVRFTIAHKLMQSADKHCKYRLSCALTSRQCTLVFVIISLLLNFHVHQWAENIIISIWTMKCIVSFGCDNYAISIDTLDLLPKHKTHCILHCIIHCTMQEISDFLHCAVYYTVWNTLHFVLWKQVYRCID